LDYFSEVLNEPVVNNPADHYSKHSV
jgi:hypothetical protein